MAQIRHRNVRTIAFKEAVNPVLPSSAVFVAYEAHHLLFGRGFTERIGTVRHRHSQLPASFLARRHIARYGDAVRQIKKAAGDISEKYVSPPHSTDFGVMFLPTEGLFSEVIRRPGLTDFLQHEYRVTVAGSTTLAALLSALQMGFRTLAIQKRSSEVWRVLGAVKTEFGKYAEVLDNIKKEVEAGVG